MSAERTFGDFGSRLREARERRGVTLRQIANATKISVGQLDSLEKNNISKLPGGIFSRAFVRSYALEVGLDPETTIQDFIAQFPHDSVTIGHPASDRVEDNDALEGHRRMAGTFLWLLVVSVPVAAAVLYFSVTNRLVAPPPTAEKTVAAPTHQAPAVAAVSTSEPPAPASSPTSAGVPAAPPNVAPDRPGSGAVALAAPAATPPVGEVLLVGLSVRRPCWVSASVDGQKVIDRLLEVGERRTLEVRRELVITAGDASAVALIFNGAEARLIGKSGEVVTTRFDLNSFKSFLQVR